MDQEKKNNNADFASIQKSYYLCLFNPVKMKRYTSKETQSSLHSLGFYQIIGGGVGILMILWAAYSSLVVTFSTVMLLLLILLCFGYSIFCGLLCLKERESAIRYSLINQFLQVISFAALGFGFEYVAGISLNIGADLTESFQLSFGANISGFILNINKDPEKLLVSFNFVAIAIIFWIDRIEKKIKKEKDAMQIT